MKSKKLINYRKKKLIIYIYYVVRNKQKKIFFFLYCIVTKIILHTLQNSNYTTLFHLLMHL